MAVGTDGTGWIDFADYELARHIGVVALALILFEGGLAAGFQEIRPVLGPAVSLATVGTVLTAVVCGLAAAWLFDLSTLEGLLLGSVIAATDGAATFALLRGSSLRLRVTRTLEGEAGFNDPVAVLLVLGFIDWIQLYLAGLVLASSDIRARRTVLAFHEGIAWIAQIVMFVTLGLLVFPSQLDDVALKGTVLALAVVFVARPVATVVATVRAGYEPRERAVLGWAGLRGAVPVVLATFPVIEHVPRSIEFFNIVFFAVLLSTLLQGATFEPVARRLGMTASRPGGQASSEIASITPAPAAVIDSDTRGGSP